MPSPTPKLFVSFCGRPFQLFVRVLGGGFRFSGLGGGGWIGEPTTSLYIKHPREYYIQAIFDNSIYKPFEKQTHNTSISHKNVPSFDFYINLVSYPHSVNNIASYLAFCNP